MEPTKKIAEPEMAELPEGWKTLEDGTPAPPTGSLPSMRPAETLT
jgi:hypothetical protein